jgi:hypothetical protein
VRYLVPVALIGTAIGLLFTKALPEGPTLFLVTQEHGLVVSDVVLLAVAALGVWLLSSVRRP